MVVAAVLGGFILEGGNLLLLMQWAEFLIIGGTALGALLISTPKTVLVKISRYLLGSLKPSGLNPENVITSYSIHYTKLYEAGWQAWASRPSGPSDRPWHTPASKW